jgi:hypothetical protein
MAKKLLGSALVVAGLAAGAARHVAWYVNHQVNGQPRDAS